ncbi:hypothetical protein ACFOSC_26490 [Streptantibioticus rubrisoli]|uniref:Uncharacterized protein n=1 Tax=Streptantibioticus rubrisoli TaxID=1387313 RepID=A0ABT1PI08_9ACTN|nr:hypothetical protein [Streptantibioticus rubrisoli]MCQ4043873.1 hypothetical protein [Streptantibioticus rubrisoli]
MNDNHLPDQVRHANVIPGTVPGAPLQPVQLPSGQWVYAPQPQPQVVTVQLPAAQPSMPQWLRDMIVVTILVLAVVAVCTAGVCAVVVVAGGTLIGIIGTLGANLPFIGVTLVGLVLAAGWAANKFKAIKGSEK